MRPSYLQRLNLQSVRPGCNLSLLKIKCCSRIAGISENSDANEPRNSLFQKLKSFSGQLRRKARQSGNVTAGSCEAGDKPASDRVAIEGHDNRDCVRRFLDRTGNSWTSRDYDVHIETQEFCGERRKAI